MGARGQCSWDARLDIMLETPALWCQKWGLPPVAQTVLDQDMLVLKADLEFVLQMIYFQY